MGDENQNQSQSQVETPLHDAARLEPGVITGAKFSSRIHSALDLGETLVGRPCCVREMGYGRIFVSKWSGDTLFFPDGHPKAREPRYTWTDGPAAGIQLGTYVEDARVP